MTKKLLFLIPALVVLTACNSSETEVEVVVEKEVLVPIVEDRNTRFVDVQPDYSDDLRALIATRIADYKEARYQTAYREADTYSSQSSYLGYGVAGRSCFDRMVGNRRINEQGIVAVMTPQDGIKTNPVLSAQCGLQEYFKQNRQLTDIVQAYIDDLMANQSAVGAFLYDYNYKYGEEILEPGWVSGMAQGQVLSFFTRVLQDNDMPEVYDSAQRAFEYLVTPIEQGGTMSTLKDIDESLADYIYFEEIVSKGETQSHILNGYIFSMLGIYDWWQVQPDATEGTHYQAKLFFEASVKSLAKTLPYYDAIGFSYYDIWHITNENKRPNLARAAYHYTHIYLLEAIWAITNDIQIGYFLRRWSADVDIYKEYHKE